MDGRKQRRLKNYMVDNELQMQVLAYGTLYMLLVIIAVLTIIIFPLASQMEGPGNINVSFYAAQTFILLITKIVPAVVAIYLVYLVHMIIITHRICGPLVNFSNTFKRLGEGDLQRRVHLRNGDYLTKEMDQINVMMDELNRIIGNLSAEHRLLQEQIAVIGRLRKEDPSRDITSNIEILDETVTAMEKTLSFFQLGKP